MERKKENNQHSRQSAFFIRKGKLAVSASFNPFPRFILKYTPIYNIDHVFIIFIIVFTSSFLFYGHIFNNSSKDGKYSSNYFFSFFPSAFFKMFFNSDTKK